MAITKHVYQIFIKATPEQVWEAIIEPAWTRRYFRVIGTTTVSPIGSIERRKSPAWISFPAVTVNMPFSPEFRLALLSLASIPAGRCNTDTVITPGAVL